MNLMFEFESKDANGGELRVNILWLLRFYKLESDDVPAVEILVRWFKKSSSLDD